MSTRRAGDEGLLLRARVEGWDEPVYIHPTTPRWRSRPRRRLGRP
jgi:hypothetical protein